MASGRHERIHLQNVRISVGARRHHFDSRIGIPFLCECDDEDCHEFVIVPLGDFERASKKHLVLVTIGHTVAGGTHVGDGGGYDLYRTNGTQTAAG
jgi:hypothetical protein